MMSHRSSLKWMVPVAIMIAGLAGAQAPDTAAPVASPAAPSIPRTLDIPDGALVAAGGAPVLNVLYTGDVIGFIEPCG